MPIKTLCFYIPVSSQLQLQKDYILIKVYYSRSPDELSGYKKAQASSI